MRLLAQQDHLSDSIGTRESLMAGVTSNVEFLLSDAVCRLATLTRGESSNEYFAVLELLAESTHSS
eukprot:6207227-Amphidinium_carterae.1